MIKGEVHLPAFSWTKRTCERLPRSQAFPSISSVLLSSRSSLQRYKPVWSAAGNREPSPSWLVWSWDPEVGLCSHIMVLTTHAGDAHAQNRRQHYQVPSCQSHMDTLSGIPIAFPISCDPLLAFRVDSGEALASPLKKACKVGLHTCKWDRNIAGPVSKAFSTRVVTKGSNSATGTVPCALYSLSSRLS